MKMSRSQAKIRCIIGMILAFAFPAWMYFMIDKPFLLYVYSVVGLALLSVYLMISGLDALAEYK